MEYKLYFKRKRKDKEILQELDWKSFSDAKAKGRETALERILSGDYVVVQMAIPRYMVEGGTDDFPTN